MTPMTRELAVKRPAEIVRPEPPATARPERPVRRVVPGAMAAICKVIAFLLLAFGLFGYVIASLQTV